MISVTDEKSDVELISFQRQINVLVVEDDFGDYDAVARNLRKMDFFEAKPTRAKTLEAARRLVAEQSFDVFLIDYNLGVESGARFLREIGGRNGRAAAILLTGLIDSEIHEIALGAGAICAINKADLSPTMLETTIRTALYTHRLEAQVALLLSKVEQCSAGAIAGSALAISQAV